MGVLGAVHSVSPVRLNFHGDDVEPCKLGDAPFLAGTLGATHNSEDIVLESGNVADPAGTGMSGENLVEDEMLNLALEDGEIMGMTCEGQTG
jgi:hypothetical protein